jgi:hypothetical protein
MFFQPVDAANEGRFAGSGRTADDNLFATLYFQINVLEYMKIIKPLMHGVDRNHDF